MPEETAFALTEEAGILTLTMSAPGNNLMTGAFFREYEAIMDQVQLRSTQPGIRGLIIRGGGRHFSVGADVDALAEAPVEEIEAIVKPCGLGHSKARDISACMKILRDKYDGKVPDDFDELLSLPGVGRKSANLVMGDVFGRPAIVTDTHCIRLVNRMGLVDGIREPAKVEKELWKIIPPEEGSDFCHRLVYHGREVCTARTHPYCEKCCISDICKKVGI